MMKVTNATYGMMAANNQARYMEQHGVYLRKIRKDGTPGKAMLHERFWKEETAQDVINRLESLNPGSKWIEG